MAGNPSFTIPTLAVIWLASLALVLGESAGLWDVPGVWGFLAFLVAILGFALFIFWVINQFR